MGLRSWLLRNRLQTVERKLRKRRFLLKRLRDRTEKTEGDKSKLEAERHKITHEIELLAVREKALKAELRATGN